MKILDFESNKSQSYTKFFKVQSILTNYKSNNEPVLIQRVPHTSEEPFSLFGQQAMPDAQRVLS